MNDTTTRPPYRAALATASLVLLVYVITLAPTVTFWDAGEFIAAMKVLGIPHPPGTPLFIMLGHVWGSIVPFGEFAWRTNLLSAVFSSAAAGCFFLVVHEALRRQTVDLDDASARLVRVGGAAAAAFSGAFTFTVWQNSNETEVYAVATFLIAAVCALCQLWRRHRADDHAPRILLLILYLSGVSVGNHLLGLLVGPAMIAFMWATLRAEPAADAARRRTEWAQVAVVAGVWVLMVGSGLGSTGLLVVGALCFLAAAGFAAASGSLGFAIIAVAIAMVGVTPYLYLYIRSAQNPILNEAAPSTWETLVAVIRRAQYGVRTPLDDPTVFHGPDNPGRTLSIFGLQLANYIQYFNWQWAKSLSVEPLRAVVSIVFFLLGVQGSLRQRRSDRPGWWLLAMLFLVTGLGLVVYMNFKPGFSLGWDRYPDPEAHEVRERDYFFVVSFVVWGLWAGMGLADGARRLLAQPRRLPRPVAGLVLGVALVPLALNFTAASRRHGPDARLAADVAYNLLNTVPPYGILFTYGDNDTFPLWWAQEVEGIRRDVTIVCLALAQTDWYMRQLRENPTREFDEAAAPKIWQGRNAKRPDWPLHTMTDQEIAAAYTYQQLPRDVQITAGPLTAVLPRGTFLGPNDFLSIRVVQNNAGRRPIVWSITAGREFAGFGDFVVQTGLGFALQNARPDTTAPTLDNHRLAGAPLDVPTTERLAWETYRYAGLPGADLSRLETTSASFANTLALPFTQLAYAYDSRGDLAATARNLERSAALSTNPAIKAALAQLRLRQLGAPAQDTAAAAP